MDHKSNIKVTIIGRIWLSGETEIKSDCAWPVFDGNGIYLNVLKLNKYHGRKCVVTTNVKEDVNLMENNIFDKCSK